MRFMAVPQYFKVGRQTQWFIYRSPTRDSVIVESAPDRSFHKRVGELKKSYLAQNDQPLEGAAQADVLLVFELGTLAIR